MKTTKSMHYLARSLPDLSSLSLVKVTEEEIRADEAEQALNEQHDEEIDDFIERLKSQ